jgi:hypothetical protein
MYVLVVFAIVAMVVIFGWYNSEEQKIKRALRRAPISSIRDAHSGEVCRLVGRVKSSGRLLKAPFSHRQCVYYDVTVEEYRSSGKSGRWVQMIREFNSVDFLVEDDTGRALIRAAAMKVAVVKDSEKQSGVLNDATPELQTFLARHGETSVGWVFNRRLRYREGVFEPGERVAVVGTVRWEPDPDPQQAGKGYRDAPKRAVVEPTPDGFVLASDQSDTTV